MKKLLSESPYARWGVLILLGLTLSVNYYFYDAFSSLKALLTQEFDFTNTQYGLFVSFYAVPNTFLLMAVLGGMILDRLGIRRTGFMFVFFMAFGAVLTAYGASDYYRAGGPGYQMMSSILPQYSAELKMMLAGRFFYGLGAETSIVVVSKILVKWFKGKDLALAFGLKVGFGRLGSFLALRISPTLAQDGSHLTTAIWFAAVLVCMGFLVFLIYMLMDLKYDREIERSAPRVKPDKFVISDILGILKNRAYIFILLLCVTFYSAVFPFVSFAPDFFYHKFGITLLESGKITSLLPLGTMLFTPLFGYLVDRKGRSATAMIIGAATLLFVHLIFALTPLQPHFFLILLGVAFSLVPAAMWPSMVKLVKEKEIGTAYGLMYSVQNLGLWGVPILAGVILDRTNPGAPDVLNYTPTMLMFAALSLVGLLFAFILKWENSRGKHGMELPLNKR
ncbi:MAG: MFS transporter [Bacteroidetes bacterium]|nr:MAG: MFS transporter [Bacteroidota bacterium]